MSLCLRTHWAALYLGLAAIVSACESKPSANLAPQASALEPAKPAAPRAMSFAVDSPSSKVHFAMDSPLEKIFGEAPGSMQGELFIDLDDVTKSTGLVKIDLDKLTLYQQKRPDEKGEFSERKKSELQNKHARDWLQITAHPPDLSEAQAQSNRFAEFKLDKLEKPSVTSLSAQKGAARKFTAMISGDFRLHGRKAPKSAKVEVTVNYAADKPESVSVKTLSPVAIGLEEFEINPRDEAGKFVKTLTEALGDTLKGKVAKEAPIHFEFTARAKI